MDKDKISALLGGVIYPETGKDIVSEGMVENISTADDRISITLRFRRMRDPFAIAIKREVANTVSQAFPGMEGNVAVFIKEPPPAKSTNEKNAETFSGESHIKHVIAISSGKGGVGKSTVAANLAVTLSQMGYKTALLDADIYGPSQPKMFGAEGYAPRMEKHGDKEYMVPVERYGVKLMSIGFFIKDSDSLVWRGPMATNALRQLIHQTWWDDVDYLLIDLPPGTGDVHLTVLQELKVSGAVIVSTPQQIALADVVRGVGMFRADAFKIPVLGIIENMAWFTPAELPDNKYYLFGRGGARKLSSEMGLKFLGEIPIIISVMEGGDSGKPASVDNITVCNYYIAVVQEIIRELKLS